ncbi:hypothetical protein P7C70_g528, partial [Phenoliferia sp. Uapishka_3]
MSDSPPTRKLRTAAERAPKEISSKTAEATKRAPKAPKKKVAIPKAETKPKVGSKSKPAARKPRGGPLKAASPSPVVRAATPGPRPVAKKPAVGKSAKPTVPTVPTMDSKYPETLASLYDSINCDHCHEPLENPRTFFECEHTLCRKCITTGFDKTPTPDEDTVRFTAAGRTATVTGYSQEWKRGRIQGERTPGVGANHDEIASPLAVSKILVDKLREVATGAGDLDDFEDYDNDSERSAFDDKWDDYFPRTLGKRTRSESYEEDENEDDEDEDDYPNPEGLSSVAAGKRPAMKR